MSMYDHVFACVSVYYNFIKKIKKKERSLSLSLLIHYICVHGRGNERERDLRLSLSVSLSLSLSVPRLIHVYVLSDDMKYKREKSRTYLSHSLLSVSLNSYVLVKLYFLTIQNMYMQVCMHIRRYQNCGRNDLEGGGRLGGKWYWRRND